MIGSETCRVHGSSTVAARTAAAQRQERELVERAMARAEDEQADWVAEQLAARLGKPVTDLTVDDVRRYAREHGRPEWLEEAPPIRLDLRLTPMRPVVVRR